MGYGPGRIHNGVDDVRIEFFDPVLLVKCNDRDIALSVINIIANGKA